MRDNEGFEILVNGVTRTFRDTQPAAYDAARVVKQRHRSDLIEIVDRSTGNKVLMHQDGRTS